MSRLEYGLDTTEPNNVAPAGLSRSRVNRVNRAATITPPIGQLAPKARPRVVPLTAAQCATGEEK